MDDHDLDNYNVDVKAKEFADYFIKMSEAYEHSTELIHTMGSDF